MVALFALTAHLCPAEAEVEGGFAKVQSLVTAYAQTQGGEAAVGNLFGSEVSGTLKEEERSWEFVMWKRSPAQSRRLVKQSQGNFIQVFDGGKGWQRLPGRRDFEEVPRRELPLMAFRSHPVSPLLTAFKRGTRIEFTGTAVVDGRTCNILEFDDNRMGHVVYFLDSRRHLPIRVDLVPRNTALAQTTLTYGRYRTVDGRLLPFHITIRRGTLRQEEIIDTISTNPGVIPTIFELPDDEVSTNSR